MWGAAGHYRLAWVVGRAEYLQADGLVTGTSVTDLPYITVHVFGYQTSKRRSAGASNAKTDPEALAEIAVQRLLVGRILGASGPFIHCGKALNEARRLG